MSAAYPTNSDMERLLTDKEVADIFGIHRSTVWRRVDAKTLPAPIRLSNRCSRFPRSEILAVIENAKNSRIAVAA